MPKEERPKWFRHRGYLHFDVPVGFKRARQIVTNPTVVSSHSFYPFVSFLVTTRKISRDKDSGLLEPRHKTRPIAYSAHVDSHIYAYYGAILSELYEKQIEAKGIGECVLAFRALGKSNIHFAEQAFQAIKQLAPCSAVALDISGFFDNLDHDILKRALMKILGKPRLPQDYFNLFKSLTTFATVNKNTLYQIFEISDHNPKHDRRRICSPEDFRSKIRNGGHIEVNNNPHGIPQGSPISALLSNIYMLEFDEKVNAIISELGGKYYRYCDDMLIIIPTSFRGDVEKYISDEIRSLKIEINSKKTELRDFFFTGPILKSTKPLQYLGFLYDGERKLIRSSALAKYSDRMKRGVRLAKLTQKKYNAIRFAHSEPQTGLYKRKIYNRYSHIGRRNFVRYGLNAAKIMNSNSIKKQLKPLWKRLKDEIDK